MRAGQLTLYSIPTITVIKSFDLIVSGLLALSVILVGRAMVSYEIFTGRALPRGGRRTTEGVDEGPGLREQTANGPLENGGFQPSVWEGDKNLPVADSNCLCRASTNPNPSKPCRPWTPIKFPTLE